MIESNTNYRFRIDTGVSRLPQFKSGKANMTESLNKLLVAIALEALAMEIEHSQTIIGSDISVHAASGAGSGIGQSLLVAIDGSATGEVGGQRVSVSADRPGQSLIGQRISVGIGRPPPVENRAPQREEVNDTIGQLRDAAKALKTSEAPRSWITALLTRVERWEVPALSGAISGVAGAMRQWAIGG